jgi:hypothetical protein
MLKEEVDVILDLLAQSKTEEARQRIQLLMPQVSSEFGRGALLALSGILNTIAKPKSNDQALNREKLQATAERVIKVQILDDLDRGYLQTLAKWAKKIKTAQTPVSAPLA